MLLLVVDAPRWGDEVSFGEAKVKLVVEVLSVSANLDGFEVLDGGGGC